ncbi:MAG: flagellar export chaperone FliS [Synergistales bacterium]
MDRNGDIRMTYLQQEIRIASREKLLLTTYDILVSCCRKGVAAIEAGQAEEANRSLQTAQRALRELRFSLRQDPESQTPDPFVERLGALYDFLYLELVSANLHKDSGRVESVLLMLEDLSGAWARAVQALREDEDRKRPDRSPELVGGGLNLSC